MVKLLKEGKDAGGFTIKGKGKGGVWKEKKERGELKKGRRITMVSGTHLQKPLNPRKGLLQEWTGRWLDLKEAKGKRNKDLRKKG